MNQQIKNQNRDDTMGRGTGQAKRWEDVTPIWKGPSYRDQALRFDPSVERGFLSGRLITCVEVVDWDNNGGRDLLLSSWDACYGGIVLVREEIDVYPDGSPVLGPEQIVENVRGYVTAVKDGESFHLLSTSRLRNHLLFYRNQGTPEAPKFGEPERIDVDLDWVKGNELLHHARIVNLQGDDQLQLIVGTDHWDDYWPHGLEWNEPGYRGYDHADRWLGGPLRGFLYRCDMVGDFDQLQFTKGQPIYAGHHELEVFGQLATTVGDFVGDGTRQIVAGEFLNVLHFFGRDGAQGYAPGNLIQQPASSRLALDHCINFPCAVDWNGNGRDDILIGSEDGYITLVKNMAEPREGVPVMSPPMRIETTQPTLHPGVLPVPDAHDWRGNGTLDLVVGSAQGELLYYENIGTNDAPTFAREVKVKAGGRDIRIAAGPTGSIQGPSEALFGYTCPVSCDWMGRGNTDIIISDVTGFHTLFKSTGNGKSPLEFEQGVRLKFDGRDLKTVWRVRPAVVDWDGSKLLRYVTLDETGVLCSYDRQSQVLLGKKQELRWANGEPIRFTEDVGGGLGRMKLCACDWTGTGTIDLLVGTHGRASIPPGPNGVPRHSTGKAAVVLLENIGSLDRPEFSTPKMMHFRGTPIECGMHACSPEAWRTNPAELPDLLVGIEDGSIVRLPRCDLMAVSD